MVELATQSANGTYDNDVDRNQMQKEIDQLRDEIDRIADSSNFNGIKLLDGSMSSIGALEDASNVDVTPVMDGDKLAGKTQKGEYSFDLGQLIAEGKLTTGGASITGCTIKIQVADATLVDATLAETNFSDGLLKLEDLMGKISATDVTIAGYTFNVAKADGKITLTGAKAPTSADATSIATTAMTVALTFTDLAGNNNGYDLAVHVTEEVKYAAPQKLAQGTFTLTSIQDGTEITIGDETYTFKVGKDGTATGKNLIDLSAFEATDGNLLKEAANALSRQTNSKFDITADGTTGKVYLTEKAGTVDYDKDWDLQGKENKAGQTSDATWKNTKTSVSAVRIAHRAAAKGKSLQLQIGDTADDFNQLKVDIGDMHCESLGIDASKLSIANQDSAAKAVDMIKAAINKVSDVRGTLGATQNRLDHTINNLSVMTENIQDAESTIRDTDVAEEMMAYTKNNILIQSAQAMLAQANQVPQGVLQLLQ